MENNSSSQCVNKICGHTNALMNSMGDPRFDRDGSEHIHTNLTNSKRGGVKRLAPVRTRGQAGSAAACHVSSTEPAGATGLHGLPD